MPGTWISGQYVKKVTLGLFPSDDYLVSQNASIRYHAESGCISIQLNDRDLISEHRYAHLGQGFSGHPFVCRSAMCLSTKEMNEIMGRS